MKGFITILIITLCLDLYCQDSININAYNRGLLTTSLNGADSNNTPIKNIKTNVTSWLYLEITDPKIVDYIELTFLERAFSTTQFVISINNKSDTVTINKRHWPIKIQDTLNVFRLNKVDNSCCSTVDSIKFRTNGTELKSVFIHNETIDNPDVATYHDEMKSQLMDSKSLEYRATKKFYDRHIKKLFNQEQKSEVDKILSEYHENPKCELSKIVISAADESNDLASSYIGGNRYSKWSRTKKIRKGKNEYLKSAKLYRKAHLLGCTKDNNLIYKSVAAYNQSEKFNKAEELLEPFIKNSQFDYQFFDYYFMTKNKVSRAKELRENGFLYYSCGGSPDVIDSEHYYSSIILRNSATLYKEKKYELLIEYIKKSRIRINWSSDVRLNRINKVLCQMLIKSLEHKFSLQEIQTEFEQAKIYNEEYDYYGIGESMNYPKGTLMLFEIPLKLYDSNSWYEKYSKERNDKPLINFEDQNENMKEKTIINELLSITIDKK